MSYNLITTPFFEKELKHLAKKYPSLKKDYEEFINSVEANPEQGVPLGKHCFKIRMAITSKGKGKSGGARIIICVRVIKQIVYLLSIYDKSEKENLTKEELDKLLEQIK